MYNFIENWERHVTFKKNASRFNPSLFTISVKLKITFGSHFAIAQQFCVTVSVSLMRSGLFIFFFNKDFDKNYTKEILQALRKELCQCIYSST